MPHETVIICHNWRLYHVPKFIAITVFSGWTVNVCQEAHLSCPSTPQLSQPRSFFECHHISISVSCVWSPWACPFYVASLFHNRKCFLGQVIQQVRGGKEAVQVQFMAKSFYHPCQISHSYRGLLSGVVLPFVCLY